MENILRAHLGLAVAATLLGCRSAAPADTYVITTSGVGEVAVPPTRARVSLGAETHAPTAALATHGNDSLAGRLLAALRSEPRCDSVRVLNVGVSPIKNDKGAIVGYAALAYIGFITRDLDSLGPLLNLAVRSGATSVSRVAFESESAVAGHGRALELAVARARADAQVLAKAAGVELKALTTLETGGGGFTSAFEEASITSDPSTAEFGNARSGVISIGPTPRSLSVSAYVTGRWLIGPQ